MHGCTGWFAGSLLVALLPFASASGGQEGAAAPAEDATILVDAPPEEAGGLAPFDGGDLGLGDETLFAEDESLDLLFEDFEVVLSAARSIRPLDLSPVPVSVLDHDDVWYSGIRELPDLLRYVPGVDVLRVDKIQWGIGVRGLHQTYSDRTLLLLDGRNAGNGIYGGFEFQRLPVLLENVDRIEVVRGPSSGAWGANAFNGVVNVIEKDPRDTTGLLINQRLEERGDFKTTIRYGHATDDFAWRLAGEYEDVGASGTPIVSTGPTIVPTLSRDFARTGRLDFDGELTLGDESTLEIGLGGSHTERGDSPFLNVQTGRDARIDFWQGHAKWSFGTGGESSGYLQWYGSYQDVARPAIWQYQLWDNTVELQMNSTAIEDHEISYGGSVRVVNYEIEQETALDILPTMTGDDQWVGGFVSDRWSLADRWTLDTQARVDWYSETEVDWAGRAALLREIGPDRRHVLRLAAAKSFRTPQLGLRDIANQRFPLPGGPPTLYGITLVDAGDLENEEVYALELGWSSRLTEELSLRVDGYYQRYRDLTGTVVLPEPPPVLGRTFVTLDNIGQADAYGVETELTWTHDRSSISLWYAFNDIEFDEPGQNARAFQPAAHKAGILGRSAVTDWLTLNANYAYTGTVEGDGVSSIGIRHRLDLTATFAHPRHDVEFQIGVLDVLDEMDDRIFDIVSPYAAYETSGTTFFAALRIEF